MWAKIEMISPGLKPELTWNHQVHGFHPSVSVRGSLRTPPFIARSSPSPLTPEAHWQLRSFPQFSGPIGTKAHSCWREKKTHGHCMSGQGSDSEKPSEITEGPLGKGASHTHTHTHPRLRRLYRPLFIMGPFQGCQAKRLQKTSARDEEPHFHVPK